MTVLRTARDAVRAQLWPLPTLALALAVVAGVLVPRLDGRIDARVPTGMGWLLFGGDAGAARTVLDAVSSSMITVTSLTFSLTVVTLQLASSQFSPRLLRSFTSDLFVQLTLALFLATFIYSLTVLRSVRSMSESREQFVPRIAVTVAFALAVASVVALALFLAHLTRQIRVETMLANVHRESTGTMEAVLGERDRAAEADVRRLLEPQPGQVPIRSVCEGFLTRVDQAALVRVAREADAMVVVTASPGTFLVRGVPIGYLRFLRPGPVDPPAQAELCERLAREVHVGIERTGDQDIAFGLRQLTDVANKALSPGINDPTTAVHALGHVAALLCDLADRSLGPTSLPDDDGQVRAVVARPDLEALVESAVGQPRRYGAGDSEVAQRLFLLLGDLGHRVAADQRLVVRHQLDRLRASVAQEDYDDVERAVFADLGRAVEDALGDDTSPPA